MEVFSKIPKRQTRATGDVIRQSLLAIIFLGAVAVGCTPNDPRLDDSDVFGSTTPPESAAPSPAPPS